MKYFLLVLSTIFLIACNDKSDNQIYLRDKGYKDIWCGEEQHCVSVDSVGNVYYTFHPIYFFSEGQYTVIKKIYEPKCK